MAILTVPHVPAIQIWQDDNAVAWIDDTNTKVREVVLETMAHGASPMEIHFQFPHLSLAQIHAALSYYYQHQTVVDVQIERRERAIDVLRMASLDTPLQRRLRDIKRNAL
jgi:uncharacterized protein (DUF433 family)